MTMTTKTEIRTEYAGFGKKTDGTWRRITATKNNAERAQTELNDIVANIERYPDVYTSYTEYKVMNRTVIYTYEEWHD